MSNAIEMFKEKTDKFFCEIGGYSASELEQVIRDQIFNVLVEYNLDALITDVVLSGSRCRGLEDTASDLDFVVSYKGKEREDVLFEVLNEQMLEIEGVKVDINPITEGKTGSLEEYLLGVDRYFQRVTT